MCLRISSLLSIALLAMPSLAMSLGAKPLSIDELELSTPLGAAGEQKIEAWIASHPNASAQDQGRAYGALCEARSHLGRYRAAAEACARKAEISGHNADLDQSIAFRRSLTGLAPISVSGAFDAELTYGWVGMGELPVTINGVTINWGVDTGAEVSIISQSDAQRFGVRVIDTDLAIRGSSPGTAPGKVGVIPLMHAGGAEIRNVPVFVLPDAALTPEPGHRVPPIFGAPIMYAYGRVEFLDHGRRIRLVPSSPTKLPGVVTWCESGVAIDVALAGGSVRAILDTGANVTELNTATQSLLTPTERAALVPISTARAGVSGAVSERLMEAPKLALHAAGETCIVRNARFSAEPGGAYDHGRVGMDLVKACKNVTVDFATMTYVVEGG
jgi:predicted aspartyl protease